MRMDYSFRIELQMVFYRLQVLKVIFADISRLSDFESEQAVLFSLGAVFRINDCEFDETRSIGKLLLTATDEGSKILNSFLSAQKQQLQIDRADEYFQMLLKILRADHPEIAEVYNQNRSSALERYEPYQRYQKAFDIYEMISVLTNVTTFEDCWRNTTLWIFVSIATERNYFSPEIVLDNIWTNFVLIDCSANFRFGFIGESLDLISLVLVCERYLPSLHLKKVLLSWKNGVLYEAFKMTSAAMDLYPCVTETLEKPIYKHNDNRIQQALHYLLSQYNIYILATMLAALGSKVLNCLPRAEFSSGSTRKKWKCILQRLKMLKMAHIDDQ
ncbi:hypothetical protein I4U23_004993 [Adineta vaga]|nr:hypothetical protein I4U23_004993 [Adineta vaga]